MYSCDISSLYKKRELIPRWFTNDFTIQSLKFVLKNNVLFDDRVYLQLLGTAMGTKCAPRYACLTVGYLEETKRFTNKLPEYFNKSECRLMWN